MKSPAPFRSAALVLAFCLASLAAPAAEPAVDVASPDRPPETVSLPELPKFLRAGETIVLRLGWGIFGNAGETRIETSAEKTPEGPRLRVRVTTRSRGIVDAIYPLKSESELLIDPARARTLRIETRGREGKRETHATTVFDYETGKIIHTDHVRTNKSGTTDMPPDPVYDLMVTMMQVRTWNLEPGQSREVTCAFEDEFYTFELKALQVDRIKTPAGTFDAVEIEPKQKGELKGFFRRGGSMRFWISRGPEPQIVRMDVKTKAGTITGVLLEVEEKGGATPAAKPEPAPSEDRSGPKHGAH